MGFNAKDIENLFQNVCTWIVVEHSAQYCIARALWFDKIYITLHKHYSYGNGDQAITIIECPVVSRGLHADLFICKLLNFTLQTLQLKPTGIKTTH